MSVLNEIIEYDQRDSALGTEYLTLCPHCMKGVFTQDPIYVGSLVCRLCIDFVKMTDKYVVCKFKRNVSIL